MSEFNDSYHLLTNEVNEAAECLRRAGLTGVILPQTTRWVPFLADTPALLAPYAKLIEANTGLLLHYSYGEDHCSHVRFFDGPEEVSEAMSNWESPDFDECAIMQELGESISVSDMPDGSLPRNFRVGLQRDELVERGFCDRETADQLQELCDYPTYPTPEHRYAMAECLALAQWSWLSCQDLQVGRLDELLARFPGCTLVD